MGAPNNKMGASMPLTDAELRASQPEAKPRKIFDEHGLNLLLKPNVGGLTSNVCGRARS